MKEWTREERYRVLRSADEIKDLYRRIQTSPYRQTYHIQPITGLSSDPNGFGYHQGKWHLFYQWCPWGAVHGLKYWYHVTSKDLVHWTNEGVGLYPDTIYDNRGVHSGSAFSQDNDMYLFYTANHRDDNWIRTAYTCVAKMDENGRPVKALEPLFGPHINYTEHQRDPKVVYHEKNKTYYIFLGAQSNDLKGRVLIYSSKALLDGWSFAGELHVPGYESFGGMWECPSIAHIGDRDVLIFSPQYTKLPHRGESTNHNVYLIGKMDYDTLTFTPESDYRYLDYGFDFYAAQSAANVADPNKAILIAWMGLPDNHYPTESEEWEGSMTLPREIRIQDGQLIQTPIKEIVCLRNEEIQDAGLLPEACEMEIETDGNSFALHLFTDGSDPGGFTVAYDADKKCCHVDKTGMSKRYNEELGEALDITDIEVKKLHIFIDRSSIEIFVNDGQATFTAHVFPTGEEHHFTHSPNMDIKLWSLRSSVKDEFII